MKRALAAALALGLAAAANAAPVDDLTAALRQARTLAARGDAEVSVFFPPRAVPTRTAARLPTVPFYPALLTRNFTVTRQDASAPIAGREVTRYDLTPRVGQAARWTLWIDRVWNVPLAYEERKPGGLLARRAAFTRVDPQPLRIKRPLPPIPVGLRAAVLKALPGLRFPPGFVPVSAEDREGGGVTVSLSDGVNVLALVVAPRNVRAAPGVASRRVGGRFVWLVGNLPDTPLKQALAQIREADPTPLGTFLPTHDSKR
ncbi:transcriptional regulator [Deinococcus sp. MIMF12]|uniref:Transcriptional regulator n=1 Tax=Deinococcus rhizophilus TaxID=3049544 RepID=A0ABT7JE15_9DEIO|nr:transcriptional regulator [Deinococcus rhizophilus]MDL2343297.1 transcriptional regulator [Deinococcus rhizophilus]